MDIAKLLQIIRPKSEWVLNNNDYSKLTWLDKNQLKPSLEELITAETNYAYIELRKKEYPLLEDQLDAIWKGEPYTSKMKNKILAIKQKYPKSEGI